MRHSKNPIHSQVFVKILLKAPLISKVNYDNALFIITKLTTYRSSAFSAAGQEDMRSIVQFLLRDGASGVAVENCLIEQWALVCRLAVARENPFLPPATVVVSRLSGRILICPAITEQKKPG